MKLKLFFVALAISLPVFCLKARGEATAKRRPNIVFILADDLGWRDLSNEGSAFYESPNLDRLAAEGVHFTRAYTCHGQCVPARASFQTGLYPHECGVMVIYGFHEHQARLTSKYQTIGQLFKKAGYDTAYFGKTHFGVPLSDLGYDTDGDSYPMDDDEARRRRRHAARAWEPYQVRADLRRADAARREARAFAGQKTLFSSATTGS